MPKDYQGKSAERLLQENSSALRFTKLLSIFGITSALVLYQWGDYARNDWRPLAFGFGLMLSAPFITLPLSAIIAGRRPAEALVAYALSQKFPVTLIFVVHSLGVPLLLFGIWGFLNP